MTTDDMLVAFQQRCVQTQWMIHKHSLGYCLKCGKCRFFFPYCRCTEQKHDETINRMVHVRRREDDDSMVATHCLESLLLADTCTCSSLLPNERITIGRSLHCCVHREKRSRSSIQHCSQRRHRLCSAGQLALVGKISSWKIDVGMWKTSGLAMQSYAIC